MPKKPKSFVPAAEELYQDLDALGAVPVAYPRSLTPARLRQELPPADPVRMYRYYTNPKYKERYQEFQQDRARKVATGEARPNLGDVVARFTGLFSREEELAATNPELVDEEFFPTPPMEDLAREELRYLPPRQGTTEVDRPGREPAPVQGQEQVIDLDDPVQMGADPTLYEAIFAPPSGPLSSLFRDFWR